MTDDNSPFKPPASVPVLADSNDEPEPRSHWFVRVMAMFVGSTMIGMALALMWVLPGSGLSLLGVGILAIGGLLVRAGILDRPPSLNFLSPTPKTPRRRF